MRVGLLGFGYMGTIRYRVLEERNDCEVARIFHTAPLPSALASRQAPSWEAVVDDPEIAALVVCLPNDLTAEVTTRALERGKHVLAEKPPGRTLAEVRQMADAADAQGAVLQFGFNHRYHPAFLALQARLPTLGDLVWVRSTYGKPKEHDFDTNWRADPVKAGGGILLDQGIHMLDLVRCLCGEFEHVHAVAVGRPLESELMATLVSVDGVIASLHSSQSQWPPRFSLSVGLTGGTLIMDGLLSKSGRYGAERLRWRDARADTTGEQTFAEDVSWDLEVDAFVRAARGETSVQVGSAREALALMALVGQIYESTGRHHGLH